MVELLESELCFVIQTALDCDEGADYPRLRGTSAGLVS